MEQGLLHDKSTFLTTLSNVDQAVVKKAREDLQKAKGKNLFTAAAFFFYDGGNSDRESPFSFQSICDRGNVDAGWAAKKLFEELNSKTRKRVLKVLNPKTRKRVLKVPEPYLKKRGRTMPHIKVNKVIPYKNGRWPIGFLNGQLARLEAELAKRRQQSREVTKDLREPMDKFAINGNEGDCATVLHSHHVSSVILEYSEKQIARMEQSREQICLDLCSKEPCIYGRCINCAKFICSERLNANPWADRCKDCQEASEGKFSSSQPQPQRKSIKINHPRLTH